MEKQEELMFCRRQKTLTSISNYTQLEVILNQPIGVTFSVTVPKSFTIEQLARHIEAEYAFLVEREIGDSRFPVIECGALFDHVDLVPKEKNKRSNRSTIKNLNHHHHYHHLNHNNPRNNNNNSSSHDQETDDYNSDHEEKESIQVEEDTEEEVIDERTEAESRGIQLRFSDRIEDVLDRNSIVHVVNIDQGKQLIRRFFISLLV